MQKVMTIIDALKIVGDENIKLQYLKECMVGIKLTKRTGTEISFLTDAITPTDVLNRTDKVGIVLWIPRENWNNAIQNKK